MENIIILILFTYPGVIADFIHSRLVKGKQYDNKAEEYFRVARDFFLSAIISATTMIPFCWIMGIPFSLQETKKAMATGYGLLWFMGLSLIFSAAAAVCWKRFDSAMLKIKNHRNIRKGLPTIDAQKKIWASIMTDNEIPYNNCAMAIYKDGELIRAGLAHNVTTDIGEDPGIILKHTGITERELKTNPEGRTLLTEPAVSYTEAVNGIRIDIYDGRKLARHIIDWQNGQDS